ncbi:MAG: hypothetical protein IJ062_05960 [Firmicutes bacterium]|nr:hypothetical protein [Bacillota bacterium]
MSTRDYAIDVIKNLPEEKIIAFLTLFADENTLARMESERIRNDRSRKLYDSFDEVLEAIDSEDE